jgi:hypothetical protein
MTTAQERRIEGETVTASDERRANKVAVAEITERRPR